jgi:hypothetical protein
LALALPQAERPNATRAKQETTAILRATLPPYFKMPPEEPPGTLPRKIPLDGASDHR